MPSRKNTNSWERVGTAIRDRRAQLHLSQEALAARAGYSISSISALERGKPRGTPTPVAQSKLSTALRWSHDSIQRLLDGDDPIELPENGNEVSQPAGGYVPAEVATQGLAQLARLADLLQGHSGRIALLEAEVEQLKHQLAQPRRESM